MLTAKDVMTTDVLTIESDVPLLRAAELMLECGVNGFPITSREGTLVGVIGIKDVLRMPHRQAGRNYVIFYPGFERKARLMSELLVSEVMSTPVVAVSEDATLGEVLAIVLHRGIHPVPVLRDGRLIGIIGRADLVRAMVDVAGSETTVPQEPGS
ncbi:MAG: CBS domain-containing protein [Dehalococcoidales bacterium]|nr:CBS domain-containing protein [Dehalococcoidales bacterium]